MIEIGDRVKIISACLSVGESGIVLSSYYVSGKQYYTVQLSDGRKQGYNKQSLRKVGEKNMGKLTGFKKVAVIKQGYCDYHFAIYEDGITYQPGDKVVVSGDNTIKTISEIISAEEAEKRFKKNITAEVIGVIDTLAYDKRVENRKKAEEIKKKMDEEIKKMQETTKYEMYAKENSELAAMFEDYKKLIG